MKNLLSALVLSAVLFTSSANAEPLDWSSIRSGLTVVASPVTMFAQDPPQQTLGRSEFHSSVIKGIAKLRRSGEMSARDALRLRVAMLSPAFQQQAEDLAVIQMAFSGSDEVPFDTNGKVDRAAIDWENLIAFIERLIPLILQLIDLFGV